MDHPFATTDTNVIPTTHLKHRLTGNSTTTTIETGTITVHSSPYDHKFQNSNAIGKQNKNSTDIRDASENMTKGVLSAPAPAFSMLGPIYLRHTSSHRIALHQFCQVHAPHLLVPPRKVCVAPF